MNEWSRWRRRLRGLLRRERLEREMDEEMRFHVELEAEELERREGLSATEARRRALVAFGGVEQVKARAREVRGFPWLEDLARDLRHGVRSLRRAPGFTAVAVLTLGLGIGATTAIFSVVHAVLLRPLPYEAPERLVTVWESNPDRSERNVVSPGNFMDWRDQATVFESMGAYGNIFGLGLTGGDGEPERVNAVYASRGVFHTLGVRALHGRVFPRASEPASGPIALIGHGLWRRRYGADPEIVGRTITLNERPVTVAGVMPRAFDFPSSTVDLWLPLRFDEEDRQIRTSYRWRVLARLNPDVSIERARTAMNVIADRIRERHPAAMEGWSVRVVPFRADLVREARPLMLVLMSLVGAVLLIACVNVANLFLARATARSRELAVRGALGAGRWRIARQLLAETGIVALTGGALGFGIAAAGLDALVAAAPGDIPLLDDTRIDGVVFAFAASITLLSATIAGLLPAARTGRTDLHRAIRVRPDAATGTRGEARLRKGLLIAEVALSLVLLVGAGLLVRSLIRLQRVDHGFEPEKLLAVSLDLPGSRYGGTGDHVRFYEALMDRIGAMPGVVSVAGTPEPPVVGSNNTFSFIIEGRSRPDPDAREDPVEVRPVTPGYLRTMGVPLLRGRGLRPADGPNAPRVAVVNETMADMHWPDGDAVGRRINFAEMGDGAWIEIVGIAGDTRHYGLERPPEPAIYLPHAQKPWGWMSWMTVMVRTESDPLALVPAVKRMVWQLDDRLPIRRAAPVTGLYAESAARRRFATVLVGAFAALALVLGAIGIYGVVAYGVTRRRREIGVRMALGARRRTVAFAVIVDGLVVTLAGMLAGAVAALALTRLMSSLLFGIEPTDPVTFAGVTLVLGLVAVAASYLPARRAMRVDPMAVLREE